MGPIRQGPRDSTPQTLVCRFVFLWTSICLSRTDSIFYLELIKVWKKTEWSLLNKKVRQCHPLPHPFSLQPHPRSLNYIPSNLVCPWILIHPFQTQLSTLTISPRNLILTLHAHLDFLFILDCLVIVSTADGRFIRIGFPPVSILTHFSSCRFLPPSILVDVLFAAFLWLYHVTIICFLILTSVRDETGF